MGCNCGGNSVQYKYVYTSPSGDTTTYSKEIEAQAAKIRNSGGSYNAVPK